MHQKVIISICFLFFSFTASADQGHSEKEMKDFLKKHEVCALAVGMLIPGPELKSGEPNLGNVVMCVTQGTANEGTINESKGCMFSLYDVDADTMSSPYSRHDNPDKKHKSGFPMAEGMNCSDGGFEKLLTMYPGVTYGTTVKDALTKGSMISERIYLVGFTSGYDKWFETNVVKKPEVKIAKPKKRDCSGVRMGGEDSWECDKPSDLLLDFCNNYYSDFRQAEERISDAKKHPGKYAADAVQIDIQRNKSLAADISKIKAIYKRRTGKSIDVKGCNYRSQ